jgi:hypothetical protein
MKKCLIGILAGICFLMFSSTGFSETRHRLGVGAQYWTTVDSIDTENINDDGFSGIVSYQLIPTSMLKFEFDLEVAPDGIILPDTTAVAPEAYIIIGRGLYAGVGIGVWYADDEFMDEPFFALRAGVDLEILPSVYLDINGNYRFNNWDYEEIKEDIDEDTITLGAIIRIEF